MEKLVNFTLVEPMFRGIGITPNWLYALSFGLTEVFDGKSILNYYVNGEGVCVINSGSVDDSTFPKSLLRKIKEIMTSHDKVVISSSVRGIEPFMKKYGFRYNIELNAYTKGY